ncbi:hypothetical protein ACU5AX_01780 [Sphingomonas sp. XXL09]|uniref:hypothetical protein n=1 Tax=Sphingomonas sp. XXL09 TaxID=3457787 RepID=UPI00406BCD77
MPSLALVEERCRLAATRKQWRGGKPSVSLGGRLSGEVGSDRDALLGIDGKVTANLNQSMLYLVNAVIF